MGWSFSAIAKPIGSFHFGLEAMRMIRPHLTEKIDDTLLSSKTGLRNSGQNLFYSSSPNFTPNICLRFPPLHFNFSRDWTLSEKTPSKSPRWFFPRSIAIGSAPCDAVALGCGASGQGEGATEAHPPSGWPQVPNHPRPWVGGLVIFAVCHVGCWNMLGYVG